MMCRIILLVALGICVFRLYLPSLAHTEILVICAQFMDGDTHFPIHLWLQSTTGGQFRANQQRGDVKAPCGQTRAFSHAGTVRLARPAFFGTGTQRIIGK